jgi:hypothetical protein
VTITLALALLACVPKTEAQKQVREVEKLLCQFPPAEVIDDNLRWSKEHYCWLEKAGGAVPSHRREAYGSHLTEAKRLYDAWMCRFRASHRLTQARYLADTGRKNNFSAFNKYPVQTVPELLEEAELFISALEELLGKDNFNVGRMPPPVPYWRFQWID